MKSRFFSSSVAMGGERTRFVREFFLRCNEKAIHASRRSITRGLELVVDREMLHSVGLWHRELFYLEQDQEPALPLFVKGGVPDGFVQVSSNRVSPDMVVEGRNRFNRAQYVRAWDEFYYREEYDEDAMFRAIREGCSPYGINHFRGLARIRRMLRLSRRQLWIWVYIRKNDRFFGRRRWEKGSLVWVHEDMLCNLRQHVDFVKSV
jgi:hypothetical protein